jgi:alkanesulfonate monooxygenase SsuD/methylene tetrahydromethanopterin reductase-like flavin-dependent oxidoreductase (luciferase family)
MTNHFEIGLYTFAELTPDPDTGEMISPAQRLQYFLERVELAEQVGLDVIGLGEHHRPDFVSSAPEVALAAAAARTRSIRLSSAVTVLSSGRGSFIESFPLFGYDLQDYNELFVEKLELLLQIRASERVTWSGRHRPPLEDRGVYPRPFQEKLPIWIAVGGTPQSVVRAGSLGLNLALAIIGGMPEQFAPMKTLYQQAAAQAGHDPAQLAFSINSHGFIADDRQQAMDEAYPHFAQAMNKIGRERGWPPMTREQFDASCMLRGANFIGTPDDVIEKILYQHEIFGHQRFLLMMGIGTMPHDKVMHAIELLGTKVAPVARKEIARRTT